MREVKYRGKRLDNGEWVYGSLITPYTAHLENGAAIIHHIELRLPYRVDPETVGEYIGRKDKNGVDIYEGDILNGGALVEWFDDLAYDSGGARHPGFYCKRWFEYLGDDDHEISYHYSFNEEVEVVGNRHDNPELLKQ